MDGAKHIGINAYAMRRDISEFSKNLTRSYMGTNVVKFFSDLCEVLRPHRKLLNCQKPQKLKSPYDCHLRYSDESSNIKKKYSSGSSDGVQIDLDNSYKLYCLDEGPPESCTVSKSDANKYFKQMVTIRRLENVSAALYREKHIRGFCHLYIGEEACAVGLKAAMDEKDCLITAYRCHGWSYLMGISPFGLLAELTGRQGGCQRGKGGSMHMYSPNYFGGNGIVGAQVPVGTGVALALQYKNKGGVCIACYGDGAANQGQVFESYNMACLWKLPIIFVCENNQYGMGTSAERSSCSVEYYTRGDYVPGIWVDGMNVFAVRTAGEFAKAYALKNGPIILEMSTYRYQGHSMSDPGKSYRKHEEVEEIRKKRDPIQILKSIAASKGLLTEQEMKDIENSIRKEVDEAAEKSKADKEIDLKELTADIYSLNLLPKIRGTIGHTLPHIQINKGGWNVK